MNPRLSLANVTKKFGDVTAVDNISLTIHEGEFMALLGASGCGKSTTLRLLAGLETATEGQIMLRGQDVTAASPSSRNIALMFQSYALYPHLSVFQNITMPLRLRGLTPVERLPGMGLVSKSVRERQLDINAKGKQVAEMLLLGELLDRKPGQLSGGQQQRVALARALVREPSAFLLDEPLSNLDTQLRAETRNEIKELHKRTGYPFLLVTHDQSDALSMADKVAVMMDGRVAQIGTPKEIFQTPASISVAEFIGHHRINMLAPGAAEDLHASGARLSLGVRPEDLKINAKGSMEAVVESLTFHGEETILGLKSKSESSLRLVKKGSEALPNVGETVRLSADPKSLHCFDSDGLRQDIDL